MARALNSNVTKGKRRKGQLVGYLRVSTLDQKELRQLEGISLDTQFVDRASGKDLHRPQLEELSHYVREGDTVICHSMDRLARNLDDLRKVVLGFTERAIRVRFEKENLTFTGEDSPMSHLLLSVLGVFAQFSGDLIRERQREGIALAKLREGAYVGRKPFLTPFPSEGTVAAWQGASSGPRLRPSWASAVRPFTGVGQEQGSEDQAAAGHQFLGFG